MGKRPYESFAQAEQTLKYRRASCNIYKCSYCGKYHVGAHIERPKNKKEKRWKSSMDWA